MKLNEVLDIIDENYGIPDDAECSDIDSKLSAFSKHDFEGPSFTVKEEQVEINHGLFS